MTIFYIYLLIAGVGSIYLSRKYWREWRATPSKYNVMTGRKLIDRTIDAYVFVVAFIFNYLLFPIALIELGIKNIKKKEEKNYGSKRK